MEVEVIQNFKIQIPICLIQMLIESLLLHPYILQVVNRKNPEELAKG